MSKVGQWNNRKASPVIDAEFWITSEGVSPGIQAANELTGKITFSGDVTYADTHTRNGNAASIDVSSPNRNWTWDTPFSVAPSGVWTFEAWLYHTGRTSGVDHILFLAATDNQAFSIAENGERVYTVGSPSQDISPEATIANAWYHFMIKNIGGTMKFFINLVEVTEFSTPATKSLYGNGVAYLGSDTGGGSDFAGSVDSMRLSLIDVPDEDTLYND